MVPLQLASQQHVALLHPRLAFQLCSTPAGFVYLYAICHVLHRNLRCTYDLDSKAACLAGLLVPSFSQFLVMDFCAIILSISGGVTSCSAQQHAPGTVTFTAMTTTISGT